jgi:hypothetical protein
MPDAIAKEVITEEKELSNKLKILSQSNELVLFLRRGLPELHHRSNPQSRV